MHIDYDATMAAVAAPSLPAGTYTQSCSSCSRSGTVLSCGCGNIAGSMVQSSLDTSFCEGSDIGNNNGYLACNGHGGPPSLPGGSYAQSCDGCTLNGTTLACSCGNESGGRVSSSLDLASCGGSDVNNNNGSLVCH